MCIISYRLNGVTLLFMCVQQLMFIFKLSAKVVITRCHSFALFFFYYFFFLFGWKQINRLCGHLWVLSLKPKNAPITYVLFNDGVMHLLFVPAVSPFGNLFVPLKVIVINTDLAKSLDGEIKCCSGSPPFPTLSAPSHWLLPYDSLH